MRAMSANPYNYNLPVEPDMFFGRHTDVATIVERLTAVQGDSVALIGGRRMGKTSMLEAIVRTIAAADGDLMTLPLLLDLSGEGIDSASGFFQTVTTIAWESLATLLPTPPDLPALRPSAPPAPTFRATLEGWNRSTMAQCGRRLRLILLLDECEEIVEQPWAAEVHAGLRALLVGQTTRSLLKVVMAGSHRFLTQVHQRGSPLWNVLVYHMLRVLDEAATRDLILQPTGGALPEPIVQVVAAQSGGHPRLTQYVMYQLWEQGLVHATPMRVAQIAAAFPTSINDFEDWMRGLGELGSVVYQALARAPAALGEHEIQAAVSVSLADVLTALNALSYHGLVVQDGARRYRVTAQMFRDWFTTNQVDRSALPQAEEDEQVIALHALIWTHQQRLNQRRMQQAKLGYSADPSIALEIADIERQIVDLERQLRSLS
jgi:conflict system STAND superfamily ATPase